MTIYVLVILIAVGLAQVYFLVRLQRSAMDLMRIEERAGRLDTAVHVLTDTCETGFRSIAREIGRAPVEMSPPPKKSANRRVRTAARTGQTIAAIAAAERMSEGEVRLRLQMPSNGGARNGNRNGNGDSNGNGHRDGNGSRNGRANGNGRTNGNGHGNGHGNGRRAGDRNGGAGRREAAGMHFDDDLFYEPDADAEPEPDVRPARRPRPAPIPRNAAALRAKPRTRHSAPPAPKPAPVAPKSVTAVRSNDDVLMTGGSNRSTGNGNGNGQANGHGHADGHGGDAGMESGSDGGPKEGKSRGTVRPS
jgi:hypothetical protein